MYRWLHQVPFSIFRHLFVAIGSSFIKKKKTHKNLNLCLDCLKMNSSSLAGADYLWQQGQKRYLSPCVCNLHFSLGTSLFFLLTPQIGKSTSESIQKRKTIKKALSVLCNFILFTCVYIYWLSRNGQIQSLKFITETWTKRNGYDSVRFFFFHNSVLYLSQPR